MKNADLNKEKKLLNSAKCFKYFKNSEKKIIPMNVIFGEVFYVNE